MALLLGFGAGLLYDLLRPPRRALPRLPALLLDTLYCLAVGAGLFLFAMSAGDGRLGQWELGASLAGFLLYLHALSPVCLPLISAAAAGMGRGLARLMAPIKKLAKKLKKIFQKRQGCFMM